MIKRILLSIILITVVVSTAAIATSAYFFDGKTLGNNTFATGTVTIGGFNFSGLNVTGLTPGVPVLKTNVGVNYTGSINADLYVGNTGGTSVSGDPFYMADQLYVRIYKAGTSTLVWQGYAEELVLGWKKIATDVPAGWQVYDVQFTLDSDSTDQGKSNDNTVFLFYAVQHNGPIPATIPLNTSF